MLLVSATLTAASKTTPDYAQTRGTAAFTWALAADTTNAGLSITALPPAVIAEAPAHNPASTNQPPPLGQFQRPEFLRRMQKRRVVAYL